MLIPVPARQRPVSEVAQQLAPHIEAVAEHFRGQPSAALSAKGRELRWGRNGSFSVALSGKYRGRWSDYETGASGDALDLVAHERGCSLPEAAQWAAAWLGMPSGSHSPAPIRRPMPASATTPEDDAAEAERKARTKQRALAIWEESRTIIASPAAIYLEHARMIPMDVIEAVAGHALRFHPACPRGSDRLPAMIGLARDIRTGEPGGVHRTYLRPDGSGKADVDRQKMMLGDVSDCAIMLTPFDDVTHGLHIGEGIESALSVAAMGFRPTWACMDAGHIARFPVLAGIEALRVFGDNDKPKHGKPIGTGTAACQAVIARWQQAGCEVRADLPPGEGMDWSDIWQNHCRNASGRAA